MDMARVIRRKLLVRFCHKIQLTLLLHRDSRYGYYDGYYDNRPPPPPPQPPPPPSRDDRQYANHYYESTPHYDGVDPSTYATKDDYYDYYYSRTDPSYDPYGPTASHAGSSSSTFYDYSGDASYYNNTYYDNYEYSTQYAYAQDSYRTIPPPPPPPPPPPVRPAYDYSTIKSKGSSKAKTKRNRSSTNLSMFGTVLSSRFGSANNVLKTKKLITTPSPTADVVMASPTSSLNSDSRDRSPQRKEKKAAIIPNGESAVDSIDSSRGEIEPNSEPELVKREIQGKFATFSPCRFLKVNLTDPSIARSLRLQIDLSEYQLCFALANLGIVRGSNLQTSEMTSTFSEKLQSNGIALRQDSQGSNSSASGQKSTTESSSHSSSANASSKNAKAESIKITESASKPPSKAGNFSVDRSTTNNNRNPTPNLSRSASTNQPSRPMDTANPSIGRSHSLSNQPLSSHKIIGQGQQSTVSFSHRRYDNHPQFNRDNRPLKKGAPGKSFASTSP